jgi:uncharacterized protein (TIGR01777 family)
MPTFRWTADVPHSLSTVLDWYSRPGAFARLVPDFMGSPTQAPTDGLNAGSRSELTLSPAWLPGAWGLAWKAVHTRFDRTADAASFTDVQESGPFRSWEHEHRFTSLGDAGTRIEDTVSYELPLGGERIPGVAGLLESQLGKTFRFRTQRTLEDLAFHAEHSRTASTFLISGSHGLIGRQLVAFLDAGGHTVRALTREDTAAPVDEALFDGVDAVIHLGGEPIFGRFTAAHKQRVMGSRVGSTRGIVEALSDRAERGQPVPSALICASASGFYGHDAGAVTEMSPAGSDFLASVCTAWEAEAERAEEFGVRVVRLRTGLVLSSSGGVLAAQLPLFEAGLGGPMGDGTLWQSWIAIDDMVRLYAFAPLSEGVSGPLNAAAPHPVRQGEFASVLGRVLRRPAILPTPRFGPELLLGKQGAEEMAYSSIDMSADKALSAGFGFVEPTLEGALRRTLGQ